MNFIYKESIFEQGGRKTRFDFWVIGGMLKRESIKNRREACIKWERKA
jgi:hypothetical protein